ncbi:MAG: RNA polymerase sigma-70 factor [Tannerella sp.]|jgi:RNA polymerase sigma-70 factor (ECF subfamily)|nr:RNA polymerase sigma-70 factor [Tannerella sp.]
MRKANDPDVEQRLQVFRHLFNTCYQSLTAYACKIVNDYPEAEDIVQDVFMSFWINKDTFDFGKPVKPYLFKAVYNRSINYLKSEKANVEIAESKIDRTLDQIITSSYREDSLLLKELSGVITDFIETLPAQCRQVFKLSRVSGLKNREIAATLHISEKTVEAHIGKALKELRIHLKKSGM